MQLEKSEDKFELASEIIFEQFDTSMEALALQDFHSSEKSLVIARNAFKSIAGENTENQEVNFLRIFVDLIETVTLSLKSTFLTFEGRYEKSKKVIEKALHTSQEGKNMLLRLKEENFDISEFENYFAFFFKYFELLLSGSLLNIESIINKNQGKFVDEIGLKIKIIEKYRKINDFIIDINSNNARVMLGLRDILNRLADTSELQVEKIIENRKTIKFLSPIDNQLFLIHGHGINHVREFKNLLKENFNINPVILLDEPNKGKTIIEKIEDYGMNCGFAFAIFTPDDWVRNNNKEYFQARPNVLFELGWFIGRYGREKVRIIKKKDTELPSDLGGLITINFNENIEEVFLRVKKELVDFGLINDTVT